MEEIKTFTELTETQETTQSKGLDNRYLINARRFDNDEFYTQEEDVKNEVEKYKDKFEGKTVYCPCDRPDSAFVRYFIKNFKELKLKAFFFSCYDKFGNNDHGAYILYDADKEWFLEMGGGVDITTEVFDEMLEKCDIVVTNPPFSLFIPFLDKIIKHKKEYLIIGQQNTISCKSVFEHIMAEETYIDYGFKGIAGWFKVPESFVFNTKNTNNWNEKERLMRVSGVIWYTSFEIYNNRPFIDNPKARYYNEDGTPNEEKYKKYIHFREISGVDEDCINVGKISDIPNDYYGIMGVPITIMGKYNPKQFEIIQLDHYGPLGNQDNIILVDGKEKMEYRRIYIRRKPKAEVA